MSDISNPEPLITMTLTADTVVGHRYVERYTSEDDSWNEKVPLTLAGMVVERVMEELRPMIQTELKASVDKLVHDTLREEAHARAVDLVKEAVNGEIPQYNSYGEPMRKTTTLKELIATSATKWMHGERNSYGGSSMERWINEAVGSRFRAELQEEATKARKALLAEMSKVGAKLLAEAIEKGYGK